MSGKQHDLAPEHVLELIRQGLQNRDSYWGPTESEERGTSSPYLEHLSQQGFEKALSDNGIVALTDEEQLEPFLKYMWADPDTRFETLKRLEICFRNMTTRSAELLEEFFFAVADTDPGCPALYSLTLMDAERLFLVHPGLAEAIARLTSLGYLYLRPVATQGSRLLQKIGSRLVSTEVVFDEDIFKSSDDTDINLELYDPTYILRNSRDTLHRLCVKTFICNSPLYVYPHLAVLTIAGGGIWLPSAASLHRAFPNLSELEILSAYAICSQDRHEEWRATQRDYWETYGTWREMKAICGSLVNLYLLAPTCPIERVDIGDRDDAPLDAKMLHAVLSDARPSCLRLGAFVEQETFLDVNWMGALTEKRSPPLRALDITMRMMFDEDGDVGQALEKLCEAVASLSLEALKLTIDGSGREGRGSSPQLDSFLRNIYIHIEALAHRIKSSNSSMQAVAVILVVDTDKSEPLRDVWLGPKEVIREAFDWCY